MLRIGVSYSKFATAQSGGARESLLTMLNGVAEKRNIIVDVFQTPPTDELPEANFEYQIRTATLHDVPKLTWTNQVLNRLQWGRYLRKWLSTEHDLLITQNALAPVSIRVANELDIPSLFFVRSMALSGYEKYYPDEGHLSNLSKTDLGGRVQYPFLRRNFHEYRCAAQNATRTIANSEFTATKIEELFHADSTIIYPPIELENYSVEYNRNSYITMVNPRAEYKGADIFLDIAEELPNEQFLLVGSISSKAIERKANQLSNVTHWEWCRDMREAYSEAKLVVVPSRVKESFGRVPAEAMVSGIPCIVSNRGGLPEVVGKTGEIVTEIDSVHKWVSAIERALERHDPEAQMSRVQKFSAKRQVEKLVRLFDEIEQSNE